MAIGDRIKELRESLNMTQEELAKYLSTTKQTVYKYENNIITNIPYEKIEKLAHALNTTPVYLMGWEEIDDELEKLMHDIEVLDVKVAFHSIFRHIIKTFGYDVEENFAEDDDGDTTVLFEGKGDSFEIKEKLYDEFFNNVFSFIDYGFNKLIQNKNRVKSTFFKQSYELYKEIDTYLDGHDKKNQDGDSLNNSEEGVT